MTSLFNRLLEDEQRLWRKELTREAEKLKKNNSKLDNGEIQATLLAVIDRSNSLLTKFVEQALGLNRAVVLEKEMSELNHVLSLQTAMEQQARNLEEKHQQLRHAQSHFENLKTKMH